VTIGAVYLESDARIILRAISLRFNEKFRKHLRSQEAFMKGFSICDIFSLRIVTARIKAAFNQNKKLFSEADIKTRLVFDLL